jgi:predicted ATP-binding protein involved in virulence
MTEIFISDIKINNVRHLKGIEIPISTEKRKHLILTGKNGSGKTTVLNAVRDYLRGISNKQYGNIQSWKQNISQWKAQIESYETNILASNSEVEKNMILNEINSTKQHIKSYENKLKPFVDLELSINNFSFTANMKMVILS